MERLRGFRKLKRLKQAEFAKIFNVTTQTIRNWETSTHKPNDETICKIAEYFNTSVDYLLGHDNS